MSAIAILRQLGAFSGLGRAKFLELFGAKSRISS
jgi:predicted alpha/beta-fold hydrolase